MDKPEFTGTVTSDYHTRLRDEFAMRAMEIKLSTARETLDDTIARDAYAMADAMITARSSSQ